MNPNHEEVFAAFAFALLTFAHMELGLELEPLLTRLHLDPALAADPDARIPYITLFLIWQELIAARPDEPLGLRYASTIELEQLGVLGHLVLHSASLRESIQRFMRFQVLIDPHFKMALHEADTHATLIIDHEPRVRALIEPMEMFCAVMCRSTLQRADRVCTHHPARQVTFAHAQRHASHHYSALFKMPVLFEQPHTSVSFERELLDKRMTGAQPALSHYIDRYLESLLDTPHYPDPSDAPSSSREDVQPLSTSDRVRAFLAKHLREGLTQQADAARALHTSTRTLQRQLSKEETTFARLLAEVRYAQATHLLTTTKLPIYEIAYLLGYHDAPSFYRAFKQWAGCSPEQRRHGSGSAS